MIDDTQARRFSLPTGCPSGHHNPLHCVIPPHMLDAIITNGTPEMRKSALDSLNLTHSLDVARVGFNETNRQKVQATRSQRLAFGPVATNGVGGQPQRTIYIATGPLKQTVPGTQVRGEGDSETGDAAVDEAYNDLGNTYNFYWQVFNRNSIDDAGLPLNGTVHYGNNYDNAYWDGQRMVFGDGDNKQFLRFTIPVEVIGHELTHGVTQNESGLIYWAETGALNESLSDVFGSLVKQFANNVTAAQADWIIGEGLFTPSVQGVGVRSLKAPGTAYNDPVLGKDPQPAHMNAYQITMQDNGGVHINSGIPNHAFYLAAVAIGGYAWQKAGLIWYAAMTNPALDKTAKFLDFANLTVQTAQQLFGVSSLEQKAVVNGWIGVGIQPQV